MSVEALTWVNAIPYDAVRPLPFRVLLKLANFAHPDGGGAFPGKPLLADELGVSERSIQRALRDLETEGYIVPGDQRLTLHEPANRRRTVWALPITTDPTQKPQIEGLEDASSGETSRGDIGETELFTGETSQGVLGRQLLSPITVIKPSLNKHSSRNLTKRKRARAVRFATAICPSTLDKHRYNAEWKRCADCGSLPIPYIESAS